MRKSNQRRGPLAGFAIGVLFCFIGMSLILYLSWGFIKDSLKESKTPNDYAEEQSLPVDNNGEPIPNDSANQPNTGMQTDAFGNTIPEAVPDLEAYPAPTYSNGQLGVAQGAGGMGHLKKVPGQYTSKEEFVHKNVHTSLMNMIFAAKNDGISLNLVSAFRSYSHQKRIWENKWGNSADNDTGKAKSILRYSSFPGTSRHHWGTDVDFNSVSLSFWNTAQGKKIHNWLTKNGPQFGFCQIYAAGRGRGYSDEPWHWTHAYTASQYYNQLSNPQVLNIALSQDIKGAAAVRQIPDEMMGYITGVSGCNVSSAPQQVNYPTEKPHSNRKIPLHEETPQNNPNLRASPAPASDYIAESHSDSQNSTDNGNVNPKPPLQKGNEPVFQKQGESNPNVKIHSQNGITMVKGDKLY
ncbi:M15 family metallopeptidase [Psychrobacter urativorans]|uniref:D-alanyl-D-alanine carboxypeptidase-like core domain-containing protein n=1 Tax=Psychrobacter urativorans TaxID=45610 RepID=A0A0M5MK68_9GAMM|nr:M15 family metallopeptidase [Psychrobacter urativorans]ALF60092.1 hypothetical protein AOC03_08635 [Psychrobacter urativorans]